MDKIHAKNTYPEGDMPIKKFCFRLHRHLCGKKAWILLGCCISIMLILRGRNRSTNELSQAVKIEAKKVGKLFQNTLEKRDALHSDHHSVGFKVTDKDGKDLRCKTRSLGCFQLAKSLGKNVLRTRQRSLSACLLECSESKYSYFGKFQDKCYCTNDTKGFVDPQKYNICPPFLTNGTTNISRFEVLFIVEKCHQDFTSDDQVEKFRAGCVYLPKDIPARSELIQSESLRSCMTTCEDNDYPLALYQFQKSTCLCTYPSTLFTSATLLQNMLKKCENSLNEGAFHIYHTHVDDQFCTRRRFLNQKEAPVTMLASAPGSGNTWVRYLLEVATGIYTGSVYGDRALRRGGFIGEGLPHDTGQTFVVKDHVLVGQKRCRTYERSVILVRNPFHALLAEYHRSHKGGHAGVANITDAEEFKRATHWKIKQWSQMYKNYFNYTTNDKILVYYEDLKEDLVSQMKRVINFFPQNLVKKYIPNVEQRLVCLLLDHTGSFKRPSRQLPSEIYEEELGKLTLKQIEIVNELFEKNGFGRLPESYKTP